MVKVVATTSKTAAEVRLFRSQIGLTDPFIVENGGAIYGNRTDIDDEWELVLGNSYEDLRSKLKQISLALGYDLIPLNDLSNVEITELTGEQPSVSITDYD